MCHVLDCGLHEVEDGHPVDLLPGLGNAEIERDVVVAEILHLHVCRYDASGICVEN